MISGILLAMSGRQKFETSNVALAAVLNVVLNLLLIPNYSGFGAAIAISASCLLVSVLRVVQAHRLMNIPILRMPLLRILAPAVMTVLIMWAGSLHLPIGEGHGVTGMVIRTLSITILFVVLTWLIGLDRTERRAATRLARDYFAK